MKGALHVMFRMNDFSMSGVKSKCKQTFIIVPSAGYHGKSEIAPNLHALAPREKLIFVDKIK